MRLVLVTALLLAPLGAQAQFMPRTPPSGDRMPGISDMGTQPSNPALSHDLRETRQRISRGRADGELSKREARSLRREARQISTLGERYGRDGLSDSEARELETRVQILKSQAAAQRLQGRAGKGH